MARYNSNSSVIILTAFSWLTMKTREEHVNYTKTIYIADDGKEFESKKQCSLYDSRQKDINKHGFIYLVTGPRGEVREAFSSEELARHSLYSVPDDHQNRYDVRKIFINERFYDELRKAE